MDCGRKRTKSQIISTKQSIIRQILDDLFYSKYKVEKLKFLILLNDDDFKNKFYIFPSLKNMLEYYKSNFPGKLIIEKYSEIENLNYMIEDYPEARKLYIMLPKEKIFIDSKNFTSRLIDSKLNELKNIFMLLGGYKINFTKFYKNTTNENLNLNAGIDISEIDISLESSIENTNLDMDKIVEKTTFSKNDNFSIELKDLYNDNYYYLPKEKEWHNLIIRIIDGLTEEIEYTFTNNEKKKLKRKFINKLNKLNISVSYDWEYCVNLKKKYLIKFNTLKKENIYFNGKNMISIEKNNLSIKDEFNDYDSESTM